MVILLSLVSCRSAILNDVAASSARNRTQVTKTLLVLGKRDKNVWFLCMFYASVCIWVCVLVWWVDVVV